MTCRCGSETPRRGLCKQCSLDERHTPDQDGDTPQSSVSHYECTQCGTHYRSDGSDWCPECGSKRRRYAGELTSDGGVSVGRTERSGLIWVDVAEEYPEDGYIHPLYDGQGADSRKYRPMWHAKQASFLPSDCADADRGESDAE